MKKSTYNLAEVLKTDKCYIGAGGETIIADTSAKLSQKLHQVYSGTIKLDNGKKIVQITDDEFDNTRPGPLMQIENNKYKVFYTSNCMGLNSLSCVEFTWNNN